METIVCGFFHLFHNPYPQSPNNMAEEGNWTLLMEESLYADTLEFSKPQDEKAL